MLHTPRVFDLLQYQKVWRGFLLSDSSAEWLPARAMLCLPHPNPPRNSEVAAKHLPLRSDEHVGHGRANEKQQNCDNFVLASRKILCESNRSSEGAFLLRPGRVGEVAVLDRPTGWAHLGGTLANRRVRRASLVGSQINAHLPPPSFNCTKLRVYSEGPL